MDDMNRGLYSKYSVAKADGTPLDGDCFVLRPDRDAAARCALIEYAAQTPNEVLAADIEAWLERIGEVDYTTVKALRMLDADHRFRITALLADNKRLSKWVDDLQSGMYVNCVYCGHRYGPGETTPVSMADALKAHIEQCPEHPMSVLKAENERLSAALNANKTDFGSERRHPCMSCRIDPSICGVNGCSRSRRFEAARAELGGRDVL